MWLVEGGVIDDFDFLFLFLNLSVLRCVVRLGFVLWMVEGGGVCVVEVVEVVVVGLSGGVGVGCGCFSCGSCFWIVEVDWVRWCLWLLGNELNVVGVDCLSVMFWWRIIWEFELWEDKYDVEVKGRWIRLLEMLVNVRILIVVFCVCVCVCVWLWWRFRFLDLVWLVWVFWCWFVGGWRLLVECVLVSLLLLLLGWGL